MSDEYEQSGIGAIPKSWQIALLRDVAQIRSGIAVNANSRPADPVRVHYLRVANVQDGYLDLSEMSQLDISRSDLARYAVLRGDVLMNEGGDRDKLGRGAIWHGQYQPCVHQNHVFVVRSKSAVVPEFLNIWSAGSIARKYFLVAGKQTTNLASINKTSLGGLPVLLPEKHEQHAIAEALSDVDALLGGLDRLIAKKRDLKQAAMQQLLTGQTRLPGFSDEWITGSLNEVVRTLIAGVSVNSTDDLPSDGVPCVLKTSALVDGALVVAEAKPIQARDVRRARTSLKEGSILVSRMNTPALVGEVAYVDRDLDWLYLPDRVWMAQFGNPACVCARWLTYVLVSREYRRALQDRATGTSGSMKNISKSALLSLEVRFPSIEEQTAIATVLSDMDAELAALEARRDKTRALKQAMMQELLTGRTRLV